MQIWLIICIDCTNTAVFPPILYIVGTEHVVDVRTDFRCAVRSCSTKMKYHCQCSWSTSLCAHRSASLCTLTLPHFVCNLLTSCVWHKSKFESCMEDPETVTGFSNWYDHTGMLKVCHYTVIFCCPKENFVIFFKENGPSFTSEFANLLWHTCEEAIHVSTSISVTSLCVQNITDI
jgi:hypothetical protein